jgi:hypothetical protein
MSRFAVAQRRASPCYGAMKRSGPNERQRLLSVYIPQSAFRNPHFIEANSAQQLFLAQSLNQVAIIAEDHAAHSVLIGSRHIDS